MGIIYPSVEHIITTHAKTIEISGGGIPGLRDYGPLEGTLTHIQNDEYYPTLERKICRLFFGLAKFHCFVDGNKRIAITASSLMLMSNGYMIIVPRFMRDMENVSVHVAANVIDEELLHEIICSHTSFDPDNEGIKLKLLEALGACAMADGPKLEG